MKFALLATWLLATGTAHSEYRVALIIGDNTGPIAKTCREFGFRCEVTPNLNQKELLRKIESWSDRTPTNSTALVYFGGKIGEEKFENKPAPCLIASNDRPVAIAQVLERLRTRGGSRRNIVLTGSRSQSQIETPEDCSVSDLPPAAYFRQAPITGTGSVAIAPPDRFVLGKKAGDEWVNARGMVFCWCPPGKYTAGSPVGTPLRFPDETQREVAIREGFWIGKYEHTRGQKLRNLSNKMIGTHKNEPVNQLHWDDGSRMVTKTLTDAEHKAGRLPADWQYSLPTEDQWEYAARAGTTSRYYFGDDVSLLPQHANFADKSFYDSGDIYSNPAHRNLDDGFVRLAPVGSFKPNPWGLHDIYGNVTEWCIDQGARGGSWVSIAEACRSGYRDRYSSRNEQNYLGYRFVIQRTPPPKPENPKKG